MATSSAQIMSEFNNPNIAVLISEEQIRDRIKELGAQITRDYAGRNPLLIGVLKGACFFLSDLLRAIDARLGIELRRFDQDVGRGADYERPRCSD